MKELVTVSTRGQIVIPQEARERLGIRAGTRLRMQLSEDRIELRPIPEDLIGSLCGVVKRAPSLAEALLKEREADRGREEQKGARRARGPEVSAKRKRARNS